MPCTHLTAPQRVQCGARCCPEIMFSFDSGYIYGFRGIQMIARVSILCPFLPKINAAIIVQYHALFDTSSWAHIRTYVAS